MLSGRQISDRELTIYFRRIMKRMIDYEPPALDVRVDRASYIAGDFLWFWKLQANGCSRTKKLVF